MSKWGWLFLKVHSRVTCEVWLKCDLSVCCYVTHLHCLTHSPEFHAVAGLSQSAHWNCAAYFRGRKPWRQAMLCKQCKLCYSHLRQVWYLTYHSSWNICIIKRLTVKDQCLFLKKCYLQDITHRNGKESKDWASSNMNCCTLGALGALTTVSN